MARACNQIPKSEIPGAGNMIFVTVGTEKFAFNRLVCAIDNFARDGKIKDVFVQTGCATYKPKSVLYKNFLDFNEMQSKIKSADIVISHAGVGSVLLALSNGKIPIIFPRFHKYQEHLDDHQIEFAKKMSVFNKVILACDGDELLEKIINYDKYLKDRMPLIGESRRGIVCFLEKVYNGLSK